MRSVQTSHEFVAAPTNKLVEAHGEALVIATTQDSGPLLTPSTQTVTRLDAEIAVTEMLAPAGVEVAAINTAAINLPPASPERRWLARYPACVPHTLKYPALPAYGLLEHSAAEFPDRTACIHLGHELKYRELREQARATADMLVRFGVRPGDRVGLLLPNVPEFLSAINGIWMAGAAAVAISPLCVAEEISDLVAATNCRVVISLDMLAPLLWKEKHQPDVTILTSLAPRLTGYKKIVYTLERYRRQISVLHRRRSRVCSLDRELKVSNRDFEPVRPVSLDAPAFLLATGGTTGHPKVVSLSHRNLIANATQIHAWAGTQMGNDSVLAIVPMFHSLGLSSCAMAGVSMAATIVMHHRFVPEVVARLIERYEPTVMPAVPAMLVTLNDLFKTRPVPKRALRMCISGGAPLDQRLAEEFSERTGTVVVEGFGLSEAGPVTHVGPLDGTHRPGTIGLPMPDTDVRIVDPETGIGDMPRGEIGELIIRGPQMMLGYWNDPEATARTIRDGWLFTGDLATEDEDGFFRIVDRKKDLIITSGFNVYPSEVEPVLRACPGVADVAVVGVPDRERGEIVKAVVAVKPGEQLAVCDLEAYCEEHLAKHKQPRLFEIIVGADLPRNFLAKYFAENCARRTRPKTRPPRRPSVGLQPVR